MNFLTKHVTHGLLMPDTQTYVSATVLKTKTLYYAKEFSYEEFQVLDVWLHRYKKRYNTSFMTVSGISFR